MVKFFFPNEKLVKSRLSHFNPSIIWDTIFQRDESPPPTAEVPQPYAQAQDGKTEMSLVHFSLTHPGWVPPQPESETFVQNLRGQAAREAEQLTTLTEEELAGEWNNL